MQDAIEETDRVEPECRFCGQILRHTFVDLGMSPLCESFVPAERVNAMERFYPLHVWVCRSCFLVQLQEYVSPEEIFGEYAYFSSYSESWLRHARSYVESSAQRFGLGSDSLVIELASNDGYLLQYCVQAGIPCLGIEPASNVARAAIDKGVPTRVCFFGREAAGQLEREGIRADLIVGNNVLAQVPDLNDFVAGIPRVLKPSGVLTLEFPHLQRLIERNQFDTIYHEHFSYFSLLTADRILEHHGMQVFDVEELETHGGSLRLYAQRRSGPHSRSETVDRLRLRETELGFEKIETYPRFEERVRETKRKLLEFLIQVKRDGKRVVGYGAPGKGNTLLNYCGIRSDFVDFTVDRNPYKHGKFLPGTHIPIHPVHRLRQARPDYVLILPWNLRDEIAAQMADIRAWDGKFVVPIPEVEVF